MNCFLCDCASGTFKVFAKRARQTKVKSIDRDPVTGRVVWHQGAKETWWSRKIRFQVPEKVTELPDEFIYKVRWDRAREIPGEG
ncbi:MAG: hypothetical protein ACI9NQ_001518 [Paracoccaceae bacterium]